jgi:hypothetical protein
MIQPWKKYLLFNVVTTSYLSFNNLLLIAKDVFNNLLLVAQTL